MINVWEHQPAPAVGGGPVYTPINIPILAGGVTEVIYCPFNRDLWIQAVIEGMVSGESVTGYIEGSLDGTNFGAIQPTRPYPDVNNISVNGSYLFYYHGAIPPYIRLRGFASTIPNTEATIVLYAYIGQMN